jgi:hypothetical protein
MNDYVIAAEFSVTNSSRHYGVVLLPLIKITMVEKKRQMDIRRAKIPHSKRMVLLLTYVTALFAQQGMSVARGCVLKKIRKVYIG